MPIDNASSNPTWTEATVPPQKSEEWAGKVVMKAEWVDCLRILILSNLQFSRLSQAEVCGVLPFRLQTMIDAYD